MQYRLRTLLILLAVGPMVLAGAWLIFGATITAWFKPKDDNYPQTTPGLKDTRPKGVREHGGIM
jgi:hypothetical protein